MKIKAVFFDIDGTFFDHKTNKVKHKSIEACKELQEKGIKVALCSGRPKEMADELNVFELLDWDGYIGCTGALSMNERYEVIYQDTYTKDQLKQMFDIARTNNLCLYSFGKYEFMSQPLNETSKKMIEEYHLKQPEVRDWNNEELSAVSVLIEKAGDKELFKVIKGLSFTSSTPYCMDFVKQGVNKANGIKELMKYWNLENEDFIAFGDSLNDIEMIKEATIGIAMENGHEELKKVANIICGPCESDTIYDTLKQLNII